MRKSILSLRGLIAAAIAIFTLGANAQTWDFATTPETDAANLTADSNNWTSGLNGEITRWSNKAKMTSAALIANGSELEMTKGLKFSCGGADKIRIDQNSAIRLNGSKLSIITPSLSAGTTVTVVCETAKAGEPRSISASNLTITNGFTASAERQTNVGTVTTAGPVTITTGNGMAFYSITIEGNTTPGTPDKPVVPTTPDHSVAMNPLSNQMMLATTDNTVKYYNTSELESVDIDKASGKVTVTPKVADWTDEYLRNVSAISFTKGVPTGSEGDITNRGVTITEAKGWLESVYAKWEPFEGATSYNVYIKGGKYADYTKIDRELVRDYGSYCRADMVGLPANIYALKVVPVVGAAEDTASASEVTAMEVKSHDRSGFAFHNCPGGIGAYKENGELKDNARVLYITKDNAKTVTLPVYVKSGQEETRTGVQNIIQAYEKAAESRPLAIRIVGTLLDSDMDALGSSSIGLQVKGKSYTPINLTIEGIGEDAWIRKFGILMRYVSNVEIRNIGIYDFPEDGLSLDTKNSHIWIHHVDMFYGQNKGGDKKKGDGSMDLKDDSQYITFAYNHFWDSGKSSLCGMKSETGPNYIDYHHNWFDHSDSRHPRVRTMTVHVWNNYYDGVAKYGVGATTGSNVFVESNFYRNTKDPMMISQQGTDAMGGGTFSGETGGMIKSYGNLYAEKGESSNYTVITHLNSAIGFDCYEAATRQEKVPESFKALVGGTAYSNFDTDPSVMHTYTPIQASEVPAVVIGYYGAGRLNKGDFKWTFNNSVDDTSYDINTALEAELINHKSKLVKIF